MGLLAFALLLPEATEAHGGPQLQRFRLLAAGDVEGVVKPGFHLCRLLRGACEQQLPLKSMELGLPPALPRDVHARQRCVKHPQTFVSPSPLRIRLGEQGQADTAAPALLPWPGGWPGPGTS